MRICIFGGASDAAADIYKEIAWQTGKMFAENGWGMVFGAGATGMMGAAADGFRSAEKHGELIGIIPRCFDQPGVWYTECSELIWTESMRERKYLMEEKADAFLVFPGGVGTFEEFFEVITLKQIGQHKKPIILYNVNGYYEKVRHLFQQAVEQKFMTQEHLSLVLFAEKPEDIQQILSSL